MRVSPMPVTVPVLNVVNSRMVLPLPIISRVGSPRYFLSCGSAPRLANWKMRLFSPIWVCPSITACGPISVFAPIWTCSPIMLYAPTETLLSSCALGWMTAVGWIRVILCLSLRCVGCRLPAQRASADGQWVYCLRCANAHTALTSGSPAYIACSVRSSLLS